MFVGLVINALSIYAAWLLSGVLKHFVTILSSTLLR